MQDHIVQFSMDDVIGILESAPVRPDMISEITIAQVMNRAPMAHLSIERALKFLIRRLGLDFKEDHNLHAHLATLRGSDPNTAEYLELAFDAAVQFYNLNTNHRQLKHLRSLHTYLSVTGTAAEFEKMRYWELDQLPDPLIGRIWLSIHLEILRALREVYVHPVEQRRNTVVDRVEREVYKAMRSAADLARTASGDKESEFKDYIAWVKGHESFTDALGDAIRSGFSIGNPLMNRTAAQAYEALCRSKDPAVLYLTTSLDVLPPQPRDFIPRVEWSGAEKERTGIVKTPSGHWLGCIDRSADGLWHITPSRNGPVSVAARAKSQTDARCYLAQLLTGPATLIMDGIQKPVRLIGEKYDHIQLNYERDRAADVGVPSWTHKLEFWDTHHAIQVGQAIKVEAKDDYRDNVVNVLEGDVMDVEGHVVYVVGHDYRDLATPGDRADNGRADDS